MGRTARKLKLGHAIPQIRTEGSELGQHQAFRHSRELLASGLHLSMQSGTFNGRAVRAVYAALMSIVLTAFWASGFFGSVTVSRPFLKLASILSVSTPSGT